MRWWTLRILRSHSLAKKRKDAAIVLGNKRDVGAVEALADAVSDESQDVRNAAVEALGKIKDSRAITPLSVALADESLTVRDKAIEALIHIGGEQVFEVLMACLIEKAGVARESSANALKMIDEPRALDRLVKALSIEKGIAFSSLILALDAMGWQPTGPRERAMLAVAKEDFPGAIREGEAAVVPLTATLSHHWSGMNLRIAAANALGAIGGDLAIDALRAALKDNDLALVSVAARRLGKIGDEQAIEPIVMVLNKLGQSQWDDRKLLAPMIDALVKIGSQSVRPLVDLLGEDCGHHIAEVLVRFGKEPVPLLIEALKNGSPIKRENSAIALGRIRDVRAEKPLIDALDDVVSKVRLCSITALEYIGSPSTVKALIDALDNAFWVVQERAATALGKIKDLSAVEPLTQKLMDKNLPVQIAANNALIAIIGFMKAPIAKWPIYHNEIWANTSNSHKLCIENEYDSDIVVRIIRGGAYSPLLRSYENGCQLHVKAKGSAMRFLEYGQYDIFFRFESASDSIYQCDTVKLPPIPYGAIPLQSSFYITLTRGASGSRVRKL